MPASRSTVEHVLDVVERHVKSAIVKAICIDLMSVPGNKSFRLTIEMLYRRADERLSQSRLIP